MSFSNLNFGLPRTSSYSARMRASKQSDSSPDETMRTICPHGPNGRQKAGNKHIGIENDIHRSVITLFSDGLNFGVNFIHGDPVCPLINRSALKACHRFNCTRLTERLQRFFEICLVDCSKNGDRSSIAGDDHFPFIREDLSRLGRICLLSRVRLKIS